MAFFISPNVLNTSNYTVEIQMKMEKINGGEGGRKSDK